MRALFITLSLDEDELVVIDSRDEEDNDEDDVHTFNKKRNFKESGEATHSLFGNTLGVTPNLQDIYERSAEVNFKGDRVKRSKKCAYQSDGNSIGYSESETILDYNEGRGLDSELTSIDIIDLTRPKHRRIFVDAAQPGLDLSSYLSKPSMTKMMDKENTAELNERKTDIEDSNLVGIQESGTGFVAGVFHGKFLKGRNQSSSNCALQRTLSNIVLPTSSLILSISELSAASIASSSCIASKKGVPKSKPKQHATRDDSKLRGRSNEIRVEDQKGYKFQTRRNTGNECSRVGAAYQVRQTSLFN